MSQYFQIYTTEDIEPLLTRRAHEIKLGQKIQLADNKDWINSIQNSNAKFVLLGIPEDIGVRANSGVGGAHTAWIPALQSLLNIQSTNLLDGAEILLLGAFHFDEWMDASLKMDSVEMRQLVTQMDDAITPIIQAIVAHGKIPIVIGGGHNNAYPLLKGSSLAKKMSVNCINLDAHSDYRIMEGRHSGNGFRYAKNEGYLHRYALLALHENYNSQTILNDLQRDENISYSTFEDIFIKEKIFFGTALTEAINHTLGLPVAIELDLDCIEGTLSSAITPVGITPLLARQFLYRCTSLIHEVTYLHIAEGATQLRDGRTDLSTGKLIAYLISDFVKGVLASN
jgi:formiminoglutamase